MDRNQSTFCHAPWVLATSDLLAVHLDDHIAAHHCQWHLLLKRKDKPFSAKLLYKCSRIQDFPQLEIVYIFLRPSHFQKWITCSAKLDSCLIQLLLGQLHGQLSLVKVPQ